MRRERRAKGCSTTVTMRPEMWGPCVGRGPSRQKSEWPPRVENLIDTGMHSVIHTLTTR